MTIGVDWVSRVSAADVSWTSVCYGNGLFVAVSSGGVGAEVMTSPDGITWTLRTTPYVNFWESVCYGNGLYVAVAYHASVNTIMISSDGITWTLITAPSTNILTSVTYTDNIFVVVANTGFSNRVITSGELYNPARSIGSGDIHIHLQNNEGNISIFENDLKRDPTLENAIEISLFTDRRAAVTDVLPDNTGNKRGYFGDRYHGNIGSKLWLLSRAKILDDIPARAEQYVREALYWMLLDGIVHSFDVSVTIINYESIQIEIIVVEPKNKSENVYKYYYNWQAQRVSSGRVV